jgi:hypothetical protein
MGSHLGRWRAEPGWNPRKVHHTQWQQRQQWQQWQRGAERLHRRQERLARAKDPAKFEQRADGTFKGGATLMMTMAYLAPP